MSSFFGMNKGPQQVRDEMHQGHAKVTVTSETGGAWDIELRESRGPFGEDFGYVDVVVNSRPQTIRSKADIRSDLDVLLVIGAAVGDYENEGEY